MVTLLLTFVLFLSGNSTPQYDHYVIFTGTYPQAARQKLGPRQHYNPVVQIVCWQASGLVFNQLTYMAEEVNNKDGTWTGTTYPLLLRQDGSNGLLWPGGEASCSASLHYWESDPKTKGVILVNVAFLNFEVSDG